MVFAVSLWLLVGLLLLFVIRLGSGELTARLERIDGLVVLLWPLMLWSIFVEWRADRGYRRRP
jgi:hypothetical protein